eukprot:416473_1
MAQQANPQGRRQSEIPVKELEELKQAFALLDKDGNGTVEPEEIGAIMKKLGLDLSTDEITDIMASLDENGDGVMDFDEFIIMMERRLSINSRNLELQQTFNIFDKKGDGVIDFDELKEVLTMLGEDVTDKDVRDMIKEADLNNDNVIDFNEFKIMMGAGGLSVK